MNGARRARTTSPGEWDRARRAYRALVIGHDPVADVLASTDAVDLRPGGDAPPFASREPRLIVVSGPADLVELRGIVEVATGVGTWPMPRNQPGETHTVEMPVARTAPLLGLLLAMDGHIEDRSPWRTWRSAIDTLAARVADLRTLTLEAVVVGPTD